MIFLLGADLFILTGFCLSPSGDAGQPPSLVSPKEDELVSIQRQFKSNELTIYEAEVLFKEWQLRNSSSDWETLKASRLSHTVERPVRDDVRHA